MAAYIAASRFGLRIYYASTNLQCQYVPTSQTSQGQQLQGQQCGALPQCVDLQLHKDVIAASYRIRTISADFNVDIVPFFVAHQPSVPEAIQCASSLVLPRSDAWASNSTSSTRPTQEQIRFSSGSQNQKRSLPSDSPASIFCLHLLRFARGLSRTYSSSLFMSTSLHCSTPMISDSVINIVLFASMG